MKCKHCGRKIPEKKMSQTEKAHRVCENNEREMRLKYIEREIKDAANFRFMTYGR